MGGFDASHSCIGSVQMEEPLAQGLSKSWLPLVHKCTGSLNAIAYQVISPNNEKYHVEQAMHIVRHGTV